MELRGAAADLQAARQEALAGAAPGHAGAHHVPEVQEAVVDLGGGAAERLLVLQHERGDRQARLPAAFEEFGGRLEGAGQDGVVGLDAVGARGVLVHDEAAADGVVDLRAQVAAGRRPGP